MRTGRLQPEHRSPEPRPAVQSEVETSTPIYLPLEIEFERPMTPGAGESWLEVIRYWVEELRWWKNYWGSGPR